MRIDIKDTLEALDKAKCLEQEGQDFYHQAAERATSQRARDTFLSLAREEAMHLRLIQRQINSLSQQGKWLDLDETKGEKCDLSESIFPKGRVGLEKAVKAHTTETDALLLALEFEVRSYDLYRSAAKEATDAAAREMYEFLATQERLHFDLLMSNYEATEQFGGWQD
jgi:rubrerythrin